MRKLTFILATLLLSPSAKADVAHSKLLVCTGAEDKTHIAVVNGILDMRPYMDKEKESKGFLNIQLLDRTGRVYLDRKDYPVQIGDDFLYRHRQMFGHDESEKMVIDFWSPTGQEQVHIRVHLKGGDQTIFYGSCLMSQVVRRGKLAEALYHGLSVEPREKNVERRDQVKKYYLKALPEAGVACSKSIPEVDDLKSEYRCEILVHK